MWYYCDLRLSAVFPKNISNVCYTMPPYYMYTIDLCNKVMNSRDFPNIPGREIYWALSQKCTPEIESTYPLYKWECIWKNLNNRYIDKYDRVISYKFIYNVLPTRKKLKQMNTSEINSDLCIICNEPETTIHLVYFCKKVRGLYNLY